MSLFINGYRYDLGFFVQCLWNKTSHHHVSRISFEFALKGNQKKKKKKKISFSFSQNVQFGKNSPIYQSLISAQYCKKIFSNPLSGPRRVIVRLKVLPTDIMPQLYGE